jgi:pimeloyl-ACP methyl ester carboxylesterase
VAAWAGEPETTDGVAVIDAGDGDVRLARVPPCSCGDRGCFLARPGAHEIQLDLFLNYATNLDLYPEFQACFRAHQPPLLAIWGRNDPFFLPAGAEAFKRDVPSADVKLLDTGHFALETHAHEIATAIREFLAS